MARAVVIGGGIGGLTAGIALRRKGWDVIVLERAPKLEPVGSGVAVAANALKALDVIGLGDRVRKLSRIQGQVGVRHQNGRWLTHTTEDKAQKLYGDSVVILLRADLVDVLVEGLGHEQLRLNTTVTGVDADRGVVRTGDGDMEADLIVAADGIHSATRTALFPEHPGPVYSGVTAWRGLAPALDREIQSTETWGKGLLFGAHQLTGELVYYYATDLSPAGAVHADEREELLRRFDGWHDPIPALIRASDNARILRNDLYYFDTPLPAMHRGRVALIGDAAHPMTPNLGQGACQAIEDAIILALAADGELTVGGEFRARGDLNAGAASPVGSPLDGDLTGGDRSGEGPVAGGSAGEGPVVRGPATAWLTGGRVDVRDGLAAYTAARLERTAGIVRMAMTVCKVTKLRNPVAVGLRNVGVAVASRLTPDLMLRSMNEILGWRPPAQDGSDQGTTG
ncbi:FAD-dependent monooxygenase [Nonomuraea sp. NPDC026600]|uniref:FAD-dependent monooxygenase n=1 Tax=Nonomuraea sp. NPDC026600 TaxID=3155363 RepID=UPI0033D77C6E